MTFRGALVVREHKGRVFFEGKWRDASGHQVKRRLGPAWLVKDDMGAWQPRRGRVPEGYLDERSALVEMQRRVNHHDATPPDAHDAPAATFDDAVQGWLHHAEHVLGVKPSTLRNYQYQLATPNQGARKRGRRRSGSRVMTEFGGQPLNTITTAQIRRWLERLDEADISPRTVNTYRQLVCSILGYAANNPDRFGVSGNVGTATSKRREPDPGVLDFYEPEEVAALARAAASGAHRDPSRRAVSDAERLARRRADEQDAALYTVAAFTGLRMGELLALRWGRVSFERATLVVDCSWSAGRLTSPKSRRPRTVPLATPAAAELARLSTRGLFTNADDLVFCSAIGDHLDPSSLRRRLRRAQQAAGLRLLRFHDLRHSFGSLVVREVDTATLKAWMGHAKLTTTERYLHAKPRHTDVMRLDRAFEGSSVGVAGSEPASHSA